MISHRVQEHIFDFTFVIIYFLYFLIALGLSATAPKYLSFLDYYVKIYVSLFLIWRFNPFRNVRFKPLDKKILTLNKYLVLKKITHVLNINSIISICFFTPLEIKK
jgi:hypothetical protein